MSRSTQELLRGALVHLEMANTYASDEDLDQLVLDAICMRLSAGIEALARLDFQVRTNLFGANWQFMWGMRNRIAHGYGRSVLTQTQPPSSGALRTRDFFIDWKGSGAEGKAPYAGCVSERMRVETRHDV